MIVLFFEVFSFLILGKLKYSNLFPSVLFSITKENKALISIFLGSPFL
jgi:hypothetical protein